MDDYTEVEVVRFYNASAQAGREELRSLAIAGRVSQADKKGWTDFMRSLDATVKAVDKPKEVDMASDKGLGDFFKQAFVLTNPGLIQQSADKADSTNKPIPRSLAGIDVEIPKTMREETDG